MFKEVNKYIDSLIILILIYASGMVVFQTYYKISLLTISTFFFLLLLFKHNYFRINKINLIYLILFCSLTLITLLINLDYNHIDTHIGNILKFIIAFLACTYIKFKRFIQIYPKTVFLLIILSFPFYIIGIIYPDFINKLPLLYKGEEIIYANAIFHVFPLPVWLPTLLRNNGVFWEPGAYQAFINLALILELLNDQKSKIRIVIFILGVLSTGSTTGYFILLLIGLMVLLSNKKKYLLKFSILLLIVLFIFSPLFNNYVLEKINSDGERYSSFARRNEDWKADLNIAKESMFIGIGYNHYFEVFPNFIDSKHKGIVTSSSNSLSSTIAIYGIFLFMILFFLNYKLSMIIASYLNGFYSVNSLIIFIVLIIIYSSEPLLLTPLWLSLAFYGLKREKYMQST